MTERIREDLKNARTFLGIEFGSTRIKAVLIGPDYAPIASGSYAWENRLEDGIWTYSLDDIWAGLRGCYADLVRDVQERCGVELTCVGAMGFSAMMHGYLAFDTEGRLLTPFRTWRNTTTAEAAERLTELFRFNIPQRWSIAHLYQAMLNGEDHVCDIAYLTTLAGYIHWQLTGEKVLGIGDASGMFPLDTAKGNYHAGMLAQFDVLAEGYPWKIAEILPAVLPAGAQAGKLTEEGAKRMDPTGKLRAGIPVCPPEGDAGTGMVATNSVLPRTGNISAGTSIFSMTVLEKDLENVHPEIDIVATPAGDPVAMVHANNCCGDIDAWVNLFAEAAALFGAEPSMDELYTKLYRKALEGEADCGGLLAYNYLSGEPVTGLSDGRPLFVREPESRMNLANFMRTHLCAALGVLKIGMDILAEEHVRMDSVTGHGGFFKVEGVAQHQIAAALNTPVTVMSTAGEGGPWGMALLAAYMQERKPDESLGAYLADKVFANSAGMTVQPDAKDAEGFERFMRRYTAGLAVERAAVESLL